MIAQVSVVEWDQPHDSADDNTGLVSATLSALMQYDRITGEVWLRVQLGSTFAYFRPSTLAPAMFKMWGLARDFENCRWDLEQKSCTSTSCTFEPGPGHIGRLATSEDAS